MTGEPDKAGVSDSEKRQNDRQRGYERGYKQKGGQRDRL
jgi:hypothetical protein